MTLTLNANDSTSGPDWTVTKEQAETAMKKLCGQLGATEFLMAGLPVHLGAAAAAIGETTGHDLPWVTEKISSREVEFGFFTAGLVATCYTQLGLPDHPFLEHFLHSLGARVEMIDNRNAS